MRIVSLLPAATEIGYAVGLGEDVVGVSPECDRPPEVQTKPIVSRSVLQYEGKSSGETSRMVGERLESAGALYQVDVQALRTAEPDLILTQGLCEVCAPTLGDVEDIARNLPRPPEIVSLDPHHLVEVLENIEQIGRACDIEERAETVVEGLQQRIERVARKAALAAERPRTACLEWLDPLFIGGHWVPEMIALAGGVDAIGRPGEKSRRVSPEEVAAALPEAAVLMPCGFDLDRTRDEAPTVTRTSWWLHIPATQTHRVLLLTGSSYFNPPGPRLLDRVEILAHIVQPAIFPTPPAPTDAERWVG